MEGIKKDLSGLVVYRGIVQNPVLRCLKEISNQWTGKQGENLPAQELMSQLAFFLWDRGISFQDLILDLIIYDDNPFSRAAEIDGYKVDVELIGAVQEDLARLNRIFSLNLKLVAQEVGMEIHIPEGSPNSILRNLDIFRSLVLSKNWPELVDKLIQFHSSQSRGVVARYRAFSWDPGRGLKGINSPDPVTLSNFVGYHSQIKQVCDNTEKLLIGYPANHILLHGPRGTGKSSLIKALLNKYGEQGLRLVELNRDHLNFLDQLVETLQGYRACFIIFIDDLSFEEYETQYKNFKAVLEGGLRRRAANVLVYATSNRRHLIREFFSDRKATTDEIHSQETMQEKLSLADRFGLSISFPPPASQLYLEMVEKMALEAGIEMEAEHLRRRALEWERLRHGPSGRTARQFIDSLEQHYYKHR